MNRSNHNNKFNPKHRRRSIRLKGYDYSQNGAYFVTICTHRKQMLFDDSRIKNIVMNEWLKTPELRHDIFLDEYVVMPNHVHGIIVIKRRVEAYCNTPLRGKFRSPSQTLGAIVRGFKAAATLKINIFRNTSGKPVWQRNYYDHIIRNELNLSEKRKYIRENPLNWDIDDYNPINIRPVET